MNSINVASLVELLFNKPPLEPSTYRIVSNTNLFHPLMEILIKGAKKLYGNDISPQQISDDQFHTLKKYMLSIGFEIKHNYTYQEDNSIPKVINIWFEPYLHKRNCHGFNIIS